MRLLDVGGLSVDDACLPPVALLLLMTVARGRRLDDRPLLLSQPTVLPAFAAFWNETLCLSLPQSSSCDGDDDALFLSAAA